MQTITVDKTRLLETLRTNRDEHRHTFETAQREFRALVIEALDKRLQEARDGGRVRTYINLPEPQDYTGDFDRAISMVEWEQGESITLTEREFQRYVLNDWEWAQQFAHTTSAYAAGSIHDQDD